MCHLPMPRGITLTRAGQLESLDVTNCHTESNDLYFADDHVFIFYKVKKTSALDFASRWSIEGFEVSAREKI